MKNNQPKLIKNQPIGEDKFEGQAQENIAKAVVKMLEENSCQMIGIDGGWGTGKSNLVGIVEKELNKSSKGNFHVFTYDAWGHQGDLHRKAILQELIEFLCKTKKVLKWDEWKEKLKTLLGTSVETRHKTTPKLSLGIIFSFLIFLSIPIFNSIANDKDTETATKIWIQLIPVGALILLYLGYLIKELLRWISGKSKLRSIFSIAASEMIYVYKGKELETTATEYKHESNPSVFDFRSFMEDISTAIGNKRLIFVVDNFDRLPINQVKELWASIHTLFAEKNKCSNISVIVPFDRAHIKSAFRDEDTPATSDEANCYGNDFINKTFDVIFRVSVPILSDWEHYFKAKWEDAFGKISSENETEYNAVVQIYDLLTQKITPREIIAFINECVSTRITQREEIPFRYIALFIKGKDKILKNPIEEITTPTYLGAVDFLYNYDENLPKYISALVYQVDSSKALDVAYKKVLKDALEGNDQKVVVKISASKSFYSILKNTINEVTNIENLILALENIPQESFKSPSNSETIWTCIFKRAEIKTDGRPGLQNYQRALLTKISIAEKERYTRKLLAGFTSSSEFNAVTYANNIETIDAILRPVNIDVYSYLSDKLTGLNDFVSLLNSQYQKPAQYRIKCNPDEIDVTLEGKTIEQLKDISYVPKIIEEYSLVKYKAKLIQWIPTALLHISQLEILFDRIKEVQGSIPATIIPDAYIKSHFISTGEDSNIYPDLISMRIARQNEFPAPLANDFEVVLNSANENLIDRVTRCIHFYISIDKLLLGLGDFGQYPLYRGIVQRLIMSPSNKKIENIEPLLSNFEMICSNGEISPEQLMNFLNSNYTTEFTPTNVPVNIPVYLITSISQNESTLSERCRNLVLEYLSTMNEEKWAVAFSNINSYEVHASLLLKINWNTVAHIAFKKTLKKIADGGIAISNKERWDELVQSFVDQRTMESAFNDVTDTLCNSSKDFSNDMFVFLAPWLFEHSTSLLSKKEVLRKIFPPTILTDERCLHILNSNREKMIQVLASAGAESYDFKDALIDHARGENPSFRQLAESLKIDIPAEPEESEEDTNNEADNNETIDK